MSEREAKTGGGKPGRPLTPKQDRFCLEYLVDLNAAGAARRAGYSERTARKIGYLLLDNPRLRDRIRELLAEREARTEVKADNVVRHLWSIGRFDLGELFGDGWMLRPPAEWPEEARRVVVALETRTDDDGELIHKVRLPDRVKALWALLKHVRPPVGDDPSRGAVLELVERLRVQERDDETDTDN